MKTARLTVSLALLSAASGALADNHGRYFPKTVDYGNGFYAFSWDTVDNNKVTKCDFDYKTDKGVFGNLRFDSDSFSMKRDFGAGKDKITLTSIGHAVAGGFWFDDKNWSLPDGYSLRFAQLVKSTRAGLSNPWSEEDRKGWYPDVSEGSKGTSPLYPLSDLGVEPAATAGFEDLPNAFYYQGSSTTEFELGLFAAKDTNAVLLGTLKWGFEVTSNQGKDEGTLKLTPPAGWGAPGKDFVSTLEGFFDGKKKTKDGDVTTKWTFSYDGKGEIFKSVPTPGTAILVGLGALVSAGRRRRAA